METPVDLHALVHAAGDAIIVADVEGLIVLWNPAAERLFGFTAAEAVGHSLDLIIPERFRARHWRGDPARRASFGLHGRRSSGALSRPDYPGALPGAALEGVSRRYADRSDALPYRRPTGPCPE